MDGVDKKFEEKQVERAEHDMAIDDQDKLHDRVGAEQMELGASDSAGRADCAGDDGWAQC
eukprot:5948414-Karenia_brevis.AAC.1